MYDREGRSGGEEGGGRGVGEGGGGVDRPAGPGVSFHVLSFCSIVAPLIDILLV